MTSAAPSPTGIRFEEIDKRYGGLYALRRVSLEIAPGAHTGKYQVGTDTLLYDAKGVSHISAEDYADGLVSEIEKPAHRRAQMTIGY